MDAALYPTSDNMLERFLRNDHFTLDKNDEVSKVLGWVRGERKERPIILDGKHPYGIPNKSALMSSRVMHKAAVWKYTQPTPVPRDDAEVFDALMRMSEAYVSYLPIQKANGTLAGHVEALDLLEEVTEGPKAGEMAHPVTVLNPNDTIGKAIHSLRSGSVDPVPVMDDNGKLVGVLPLSNIIGIETGRTQSAGSGDTVPDNEPLLQDTVQGFMESGALTTSPETPYDDVLAQLRRTPYLIVASDSPHGHAHIHGIIRPKDVVRAVRPFTQPPSAGSGHAEGVRPNRASGR